MKIAICLHSIADFGGIINHTEHLVQGFRELGHEATIFELVNRESVKAQAVTDTEKQQPYLTGIPLDQFSGWRFPKENRLAYRGNKAMKETRNTLCHFDLVIWSIPVPTLNKANLGNDTWPQLYDMPVKQFAVIHDGNFPKAYPHLSMVRDKISDVICVHDAAFASMAGSGFRRSMIFNPFAPLASDYEQMLMKSNWEQRRKGFVCLQTFKYWKRVHDVVGMIPYLPAIEDGELRVVAGRGIEYQYMTSEDKCKPIYFHEDGRKYWDAALANGMQYAGVISAETRDGLLPHARFQIDPSLNKTWAKHGATYNRVTMESMALGVVPIAREASISADPLNTSLPLFNCGVNYLPFPDEGTNEEYAEFITECNGLEFKDIEPILTENFLLYSKAFQRQVVAQQYIDLFNEKNSGWHGAWTEELRPEYEEKAKKNWLEHFSVAEKTEDKGDENVVSEIS